MKLPAVLATDLHLTANPADEYRWPIFPWLREQLRAEQARTLVLMGDLTDSKDYHPAQLVNRVAREVGDLHHSVARVVILMGNHDLLKDGHMYFEFLGMLPGVEVVTKPAFDDGADGGDLAAFLPFTRTPGTDWKGYDLSHYRWAFMHQTVSGAVASNGQRMDGEPLPDLSQVGKVWSGDIHVPQTIGPVEYVGSPYHVHFGDRFAPRCVTIDRARAAHDLHYPCLSRVTIDAAGLEDLEEQLMQTVPGDQVKIRVRIPEAQKHEWRSIRAAAEFMTQEFLLDLRGLEMVVDKTRTRRSPDAPLAPPADPAEAVYRFVERDALGGELLDAGLECLE